jgi:tetratricopeptide (TPR) repeat protein
MVLGVLAVAALVPIAVQLTATSALRVSQADASARRLGPALRQARLAISVTPKAAVPELQQALILEQEGNYGAAARAVQQATAAEPKNWQLWLVRSRIEAERGDALAAVSAYQRAHALYLAGYATRGG